MPGTGRPAVRPGRARSCFLVLTACYVVILLWVTSRRSSVAPATLAIGTGVGLLFGLVMYVGGPARTHPRTPPIRGCRDRGSIRSWCSRGSCCSAGRWRPGCWPPGGTAADRAAPSKLAHGARIGQGIVAGVLANLDRRVVRHRSRHRDHRADDQVAWLRPLVYHAPHLSAAAAYGHVLHASQHVETYVVMLRGLPGHRADHERWAWPASCRYRPVRPAPMRRPASPGRPAPTPPPGGAEPRNASPSFHDREQFGPVAPKLLTIMVWPGRGPGEVGG